MNRKQYNIKLPPNTLRNADGTPYSAGHDDKSFGQIAYEVYCEKIGHTTARPWHLQLATYQQVWEEVAKAVLDANETSST